jgi:hypothetical protein
MSDVILEIVVVDFRSQEADSLVRALSEELAQRYNFADDGSGDFKPEDALVARSMFLVGRVDHSVRLKKMYVRSSGCSFFPSIEARGVPKRS